MRHGYTVAVAAAFIAALGQIAAAEAACNPRNPTACTSDPQPGAAAAPLELKRFMALGPARRAVSGSQARRPVRKAPAKQAIDPAARTKRTASASADAGAEPLTPKPVPTVSIAAPSLASVPATEVPSAGFAAAAEPSTGKSAFASADESVTLPAGVTIARADEVNAIDLAADLEAKASEQAGKSDRTAGVSLMTQANAAPLPEPASAMPPAKPEMSWLSRLYGKLIDGVLAAVLAIRSIFA